MHSIVNLSLFLLISISSFGRANRLRANSFKADEKIGQRIAESGPAGDTGAAHMSHAHPKVPETWESRSSPYYRSDMDKNSEYYIPKSVRHSWHLLRPSLNEVGIPVPLPKSSHQAEKKTKFGMPLEFEPQNPPEYVSTKAVGELE